ncbi:hypothetical protein A2837_01885 [Candidatus Kaiserbacteria bacterium RIFCSPHIGHO2_01_FULL_46_22]|uniref:Uncharacterized protein n=1 Tax=Candidatus Kaiserbacteria bacterium RIFCSPHIGHO2_01_FULL_46_22 TaxID=1798475 RepID=A0A1F6BZJ1_9BACT|nr:MAG: hypothetical protein A2837_01885 [Candidatus Kaiserbacteria bacterium RIFCSPHIGHO2_01_FULL_46_22]
MRCLYVIWQTNHKEDIVKNVLLTVAILAGVLFASANIAEARKFCEWWGGQQAFAPSNGTCCLGTGQYCPNNGWCHPEGGCCPVGSHPSGSGCEKDN